MSILYLDPDRARAIAADIGAGVVKADVSGEAGFEVSGGTLGRAPGHPQGQPRTIVGASLI